jgi:hypothetical protein
MKIRGKRECHSCRARWSYYETGSVTCPECGSLRSRGLGERAEHTAGPATLDLTPARAALDREPLGTVADLAAEAAAEYVRRAGFVHAGELQPLGETYPAAAELRRVGSTLSRSMRVADPDRLYFLSLLDGAEDGERPPPEEVPDGLWGDRGLAVAAATDAYLSDLGHVRSEPGSALVAVLSALRARRKRLEALDGDVDPVEAERLVRACRDVGTAVREDDETALARARERLGVS